MNESSLRKYTYGKLNLTKFLIIIRQAGFNSFKLSERDENNSNKLIQVLDESNFSNKAYTIELNPTNKIEIDINTNEINVNFDNEDYRVKIKDCLLKCLSSL